MHVETTPEVNGAVSVRRGPLVYVLGLQEDWKVVEETKPGFPSYEVTSPSAWNYALLLDPKSPERSLEFVSNPRGDDPFATGKSPVAIRAKGQRVEDWKMRFDGRLSLDPPVSPVASRAPEEALTLVPFGSHILRVTIFPLAGTPGGSLATWKDDFGPGFENRWLVFDGATVRNRRLSLPRGAKAIATQTSFGDVAYEAEVTVGKEGNAGVVFRVTEPSIGVDHYRGYYVGINADGGQVVLGKSENRWIPLAAKPFPILPNHRHRIRVEARGSRIQVWIDDFEAPVLIVEDDTYRTGSLGVRSYSDRASFGALAARALG
jgi:hypothetical protein